MGLLLYMQRFSNKAQIYKNSSKLLALRGSYATYVGVLPLLRYVSPPPACMYGVHRLFPFHLPYYFDGFPFTLHVPLDFIRVSSLRPTYLHQFDRLFTCWWWVSRLGTGFGTRCCGSRGGTWGAHEAEILFQISTLAGFEPRTSQPRTLSLDYDEPDVCMYMYMYEN